MKSPASRLSGWIVILATSTALAAIGLSRVETLSPRPLVVANALRTVVTALPLVIAAMIGLNERRARGGTWFEQRGVAEATLREIYLSRAGAAHYRSCQDIQTALGDRLIEIDRRVEGRLGRGSRRASIHPVWPPPELAARISHIDSLVGPLNAEMYDVARAQDQLGFLQDACASAERSSNRLGRLIAGLGVVAALALALSWRTSAYGGVAAVAATLAAALVTWRDLQQSDQRAEALRAAAVALRAARIRWKSAAPAERRTESALALFVEEAEQALATEGTAWERTMRQAQQGFFDRHRN
jgi:hypothetical protein